MTSAEDYRFENLQVQMRKGVLDFTAKFPLILTLGVSQLRMSVAEALLAHSEGSGGFGAGCFKSQACHSTSNPLTVLGRPYRAPVVRSQSAM